jgi:hypothetical protein
MATNHTDDGTVDSTEVEIEDNLKLRDDHTCQAYVWYDSHAGSVVEVETDDRIQRRFDHPQGAVAHLKNHRSKYEARVEDIACLNLMRTAPTHYYAADALDDVQEGSR